MELSSDHVAAGDSPAQYFMVVSAMLRRYNYRGRYLPHIQKDNRALFITFATHRRWRLPDAARDLALEACLHTHSRKCTLQAAVIMPDHVHLILTPLADEEGSFSIPQIMHAIKSESAHRINQALGRKGKVWQDESFDHVLRGEESLASKVAYTMENPVRAGLARTAAEYRWLWRLTEPILPTA
ncbi:MAG TPA: transposase [Terriglobales bacterium]|nr:transposase [Terriglobales bacterium]